jgi:hypothetical protein
MLQNVVDYQRTMSNVDIKAHLEAMCEALADIFAMDEGGN